MKKIKSSILLGLALSFGSVSSQGFIITDNFNSYADVALAGQGEWAQAPSVNGNDRIAISGGAVLFDWVTPDTGLTHAVRRTWVGDNLVSGSIFANFDLNVSQAPLDSENLRPSFFAFARNDGVQERGHVGLMPGSEPNTFLLGVSSGSQLQSAFTFNTTNLSINQTYQVMVEYQINPNNNTIAQVWLNTINPLDDPYAVSSASSSATNIRRVNFRMNNQDGSGGVTNLGIFTVDNLQVSLIPEPSTYALLIGLLALGVIGVRRIRRP
jgi:hypothetical protein